MNNSLVSNIASLRAVAAAQNQMLAVGDSHRRLSTGLQVERSSDNPGEMGIITNLRIRANGNRVAVHNAQDTINLLDDADAILNEMGSLMGRMRELLVRASNEATLRGEDQAILLREVDLLRTEMGRLSQAGTFNTKTILFGSLDNTVLAPAQIGADNGGDFRLSIVIPNVQVALNGFLAEPPPPNPAGALTANAQTGLTQVDADISTLSQIRGNVGVLRNRLTHIIGDLQAETINQEATRSRIQDTDFAAETTRLTRLQILTQSTTASLAQANSMPNAVLLLLR